MITMNKKNTKTTHSIYWWIKFSEPWSETEQMRTVGIRSAILSKHTYISFTLIITGIIFCHICKKYLGNIPNFKNVGTWSSISKFIRRNEDYPFQKLQKLKFSSNINFCNFHFFQECYDLFLGVSEKCDYIWNE